MPLKLNIVRRWFDLRLLAGALLTGAVLHIATTLALAQLSATTVVNRLTENLPINKAEVLRPVTAQHQVMPFQMPDMRYAVCRYDLSQGPIVVRARLHGPGWMFALFGPEGENFYTVTGQIDREIDIAALLMPSSDEYVPLPREGSAAQGLMQIQSSGKTGVMIVQAPVTALAYQKLLEAELARATCSVPAR